MFLFNKKLQKREDYKIQKNITINLNQNFKPFSSYTCNNCLIIPEITNINYITNKLSLYCPFHKTKEILIEEFLNNNIAHNCSKCNQTFKNTNILYYCYECKNVICTECKNLHSNEHYLIYLDEYNIKCRFHYNRKYNYYCYNCSSNLCDECHIYHDNNHNIFPLSNIFLKEEEIEYITKKNLEYNKIIFHCKNYIYLNNLILETYKNFSNNFYYIKNLKNIIRFQKSLDIDNNIVKNMKNNLQKQNEILEKFNQIFDTELKVDEKIVYLNWKKIDGKDLENLCKIEFCQLKEFQSVGTMIDDISYFKNAKFPKLQELYLTDNNISDISVLENVDFELLKIVYLNKNKIKDISVFKKVKFFELNKLFLDSNIISDISVFENIPLVNLENINLSRNKIKDISVLKKINLLYLRLLNIKKNIIDYTLKDNLNIIDDLRDKSIRIIY